MCDESGCVLANSLADGKIFVFFPKIVGVSSSVVGTQSDLEHLRNPTRPLTHGGGRSGAQVKAWHLVCLQKSLQKHSSASEVSRRFLDSLGGVVRRHPGRFRAEALTGHFTGVKVSAWGVR